MLANAKKQYYSKLYEKIILITVKKPTAQKLKLPGEYGKK